MPSGILIAFCTTLCWSIGIFPFTEAARRLGPNQVNHIRLLMAVIFLTILSIIFLGLSPLELFSGPLAEQWLWFGISGIVGLSLGDYFGFTSFAILGTRMGSIFSTLSPAAALMAGYFIIGERINFIGILGIFITIGGVIWLVMGKSPEEGTTDYSHGNLRRGILFGIMGALCQGAGLVLANKGFAYKNEGAELPAFHATWIRMICATSALYLSTIIRGKLRAMTQPVLENRRNGVWYALAGTLFGPVFGVSFSMYAVILLHDKPSVAQTIFSLFPVFVLPLGYLIYRQKITLSSFLSASIAIGGVIVLIWRDEIASFFFHN